jgi:hypothetical protein
MNRRVTSLIRMVKNLKMEKIPKVIKNQRVLQRTRKKTKRKIRKKRRKKRRRVRMGINCSNNNSLKQTNNTLGLIRNSCRLL